MIFGKMITDAMNRAEYTLIPLLPKDKQYERIRSGLIAPVESDAGCHGVIYVDNATNRKHFSLTDLDYLVLLAVQAGVMLSKFK
jgi:GAF domain-containing protein